MEYAFGLVLQIVLFVLLIVSAYTDITKNKVYNWCTMPAMGVGMAGAYLVGGVSEPGTMNLMNSLLGLGVGGGIFFMASMWGGIGFGDVKLMGAVGALTGVNFIFHSLFWSTLAGFVMAVGFLIWQDRFWEGMRSSLRYAFTLRGRREVRGRMEKAVAAEGSEEGAKETPSPENGAKNGGEEAKADGDAKENGPPARKDTIPFGAAIAFGTLVAWFLRFGQ